MTAPLTPKMPPPSKIGGPGRVPPTLGDLVEAIELRDPPVLEVDFTTEAGLRAWAVEQACLLHAGREVVTPGLISETADRLLEYVATGGRHRHEPDGQVVKS